MEIMKALTIALSLSCSLWIKAQGEREKHAFFRARVAKVGPRGEWIRVRVDFENAKFLNKGNGVEFWHEANDANRCRGSILARTTDHLLVDIGDADLCQRNQGLGVGVYLMFYSEDMKANMATGANLTDILLKKKIVVSGRIRRGREQLDAYIEKVNAVNERYDILRKKLESEWQGQLQALEEDRMALLKEHGTTQRELDEVNLKLERYNIEEDNFSLDRWALDPRLYYKR